MLILLYLSMSARGDYREYEDVSTGLTIKGFVLLEPDCTVAIVALAHNYALWSS